LTGLREAIYKNKKGYRKKDKMLWVNHYFGVILK